MGGIAGNRGVAAPEFVAFPGCVAAFLETEAPYPGRLRRQRGAWIRREGAYRPARPCPDGGQARGWEINPGPEHLLRHRARAAGVRTADKAGHCPLCPGGRWARHEAEGSRAETDAWRRAGVQPD